MILLLCSCSGATKNSTREGDRIEDGPPRCTLPPQRQDEHHNPEHDQYAGSTVEWTGPEGGQSNADRVTSTRSYVSTVEDT